MTTLLRAIQAPFADPLTRAIARYVLIVDVVLAAVAVLGVTLVYRAGMHDSARNLPLVAANIVVLSILGLRAVHLRDRPKTHASMVLQPRKVDGPADAPVGDLVDAEIVTGYDDTGAVDRVPAVRAEPRPTNNGRHVPSTGVRLPAKRSTTL